MDASAVEDTAALPVLPERRSEPRFLCDGEAEISLPHGGLRVRGRILNVSAMGCFIEAPSIDLERGTLVEVYFETRKLQFRVAGNIIAPRVGSGVGILFLHPSARVARQIAELVEELEESK